MVAVALIGPFPIRLSGGNLNQDTHTQGEKRKHFVNCMSTEVADT